MIGFTKKVAVVPLQSEANANYNPFPDDNSVTDIQAIKTAFLADQEIIAAFKGDAGQQGQQGQTGPAGDSIIVRGTDPTVGLSSKVGDLYLNTTSGTLYQRSGLTQAQFFAAALSGLVLSDSIWITKGNLKGQTGAKGDKGDGIINGLGHPLSTISALPPIGTLYVNKNTFAIYERVATEFLTPPVQQGLVDYSDGYWQYLGNLKGENGADGRDGENGKDAVEILEGTGVLYLTNAQLGKHLLVKEDSGITTISFRDVTVSSITTFICLKSLTFSHAPTLQDGSLPLHEMAIQTGRFLAIENYIIPINGDWFKSFNLNADGNDGQNGQDGRSIVNLGIGLLVDMADSYDENQLILGSDGKIYKRNATPYDRNLEYTPDWSFYYQIIVDLNGQDGQNGQSSFEVLEGTGVYLLTNAQIGKTLIIKANSSITDIRYNNVTIAGSTVFLLEKDVLLTRTNESPATGLNGLAGEYIIIENYTATVNGFWLAKKSLKGEKGQDGNNFYSDNLKLNFSDFLTSTLNSNNYLNATLSRTNFSLFATIANSGGRFVGFAYHTQSEVWDNVQLKLDELIDNGTEFEVTFTFPYGFKDSVDDGTYQLSSLKIFFAGFDFVNYPTRDKVHLVAEYNGNTMVFQPENAIIRFSSGYTLNEFLLPSSQNNQQYRNKSYKFVRVEGGTINFTDANTQTYIATISSTTTANITRMVEVYCDSGGTWRVIGY